MPLAPNEILLRLGLKRIRVVTNSNVQQSIRTELQPTSRMAAHMLRGDSQQDFFTVADELIALYRKAGNPILVDVGWGIKQVHVPVAIEVGIER